MIARPRPWSALLRNCNEDTLVESEEIGRLCIFNDLKSAKTKV